MFSMLNLLDERANSFFETLCVAKVKIAFRIMAYFELSPEYKLDEKIKTLFLNKDYQKAIDALSDEVVIDSAYHQERFDEETIEFARVCHEKYMKEKATALDKRRTELLEELKQIERESQNDN